MNRPKYLMEQQAGDGAGAGGDWRASLPPDLRENPSLKDIKDVAGLAKAHVDTKAYVGTLLRPPGPDASDADKAEFQKKLSERVPGLVQMPQDENAVLGLLKDRGIVPKEAKDYAFDGVMAPEGLNLTDEVKGRLQADAAELGLSKGKFKAWAQKQIDAAGVQVKAVREGTAALKAEWGAAYDEKLSQVRGLIEQTGAPQSLKDAVARGEITKDVGTWLSGLAKSLGSQPRHVANDGNGTGGKGTMTPQEAQAQIGELMRKITLTTSRDEAKQILERVTQLQAFADPDLAAQVRRELGQ